MRARSTVWQLLVDAHYERSSHSHLIPHHAGAGPPGAGCTKLYSLSRRTGCEAYWLRYANARQDCHGLRVLLGAWLITTAVMIALGLYCSCLPILARNRTDLSDRHDSGVQRGSLALIAFQNVRFV